MFNPWPSLSPTQARSRKKTARLIGKEPGKVFVLATFHDWRGRAMRLYHIPNRTMIPFARPSDQRWTQYASEGVEIPYPGGIQAGDVDAWCRYAEEQAGNLGLAVAE